MDNSFNPSLYKTLFLPLLLCMGAAITDFFTPLGVAVGVLYVLPVVATLAKRSQGFTVWCTIAVSVMILIGWQLSPNGGDPWKVTSNRALSLISVWVSCWVVTKSIQTFSLVTTKEKQFRHVFESTPSGMLVLDQQGTIALANDLITQQFGYSQNELLGLPVETLMPEGFQGGHPDHRLAFMNDPKPRSLGTKTNLYGFRKDGTEFPVEVQLNPLGTKEGFSILASVMDISARKQDEATLNRYIEQLHKSNQELDDFAYIASHDLKAPLRVIDNTSKWLEEDLAEHLTGDNRENMNLMRGRVRRMEKLLDDLLEYSRVGKAPDDRYQEGVNGVTLINEILDLLGPPEKFTIEVSPTFATIHVLRMPLQQILLNLINNALKHHDKTQGIIQVDVVEGEGQYQFTVTDDGPGIPEVYQEQVFDMFRTLKPRDQVEGSGMGLALVKKQVALSGGTVHLESQEGKGSAFTIFWPKQDVMEGQPA